MSETSNGMPDLSAGDSEPSMEDILASIRKIIADDKTDNHALESETEQLLTPEVELEPETTSFSEKVDEQQFEIPDVQGTSQDIDQIIPEFTETIDEVDSFEDEEILDLINFAEEDNAEPVEAAIDEVEDIVPDFEPATGESNSGFDETLDLVMDSDASDYYSETVESDENRLLREEIENDLSIDSESFEPIATNSLEEELDVADDDVTTAPELEDLLEPEFEDNLDDEIGEDADDEIEDVFAELEIEDEIESADDEASLESVNLLDEASNSGDDQDMDLVKSLLADLMDDEETEEFDDDTIDAFADDSEESDDILDEILYQSMEDETAISEALEDTEETEESELAQIARNAREAASTPYPNRDVINPADKVELPDRNLGERLNLSAAGGFVGVAAGAALTGASGNDEPESLDEQVSQMVEEELEIAEIEELLEMIEETDDAEPEVMEADDEQAALEALVEEIETPQENEDMGRAAKKDALIDEDIESESSEAFAALSHVVQEKAEMEENGPPIGDLVQDALRPMLKEWLDKNLKGIVERAVTKEVKRISSGK